MTSVPATTYQVIYLRRQDSNVHQMRVIANNAVAAKAARA